MRNATHHFLSEKERDTILSAIKSAEAKTSGEIRIFIESRCKWTDTIRRAEEIFIQLKMTKTEFRNAVLIYIAYKDREFAIFGDNGCVIKFTKYYVQLNQVDQSIVNFLPTTFIIAFYSVKSIRLRSISHHCLYLNHFYFCSIKNCSYLFFSQDFIPKWNISFHLHLFHFRLSYFL